MVRLLRCRDRARTLLAKLSEDRLRRVGCGEHPGRSAHRGVRPGPRREKAYLERYLDAFERDNPGVRVVRLRPGFIFKREAASSQRRLFAGPLLPNALARPSLLPVVPDMPGLRMQAVHSADVGEAYRLAALSDVRGALNIAAEPVPDAVVLGEMLDARPILTPAWLPRGPPAAAWRAHLAPAVPRRASCRGRYGNASAGAGQCGQPLARAGYRRRQPAIRPALSGGRGW